MMQLVVINPQQELDNPSPKNVLVHPIGGGFWLGRVQKLLGKGERSGSPHETGQDTRRKFFFKFLGRTKKKKKIKPDS